MLRLCISSKAEIVASVMWSDEEYLSLIDCRRHCMAITRWTLMSQHAGLDQCTVIALNLTRSFDQRWGWPTWNSKHFCNSKQHYFMQAHKNGKEIKWATVASNGAWGQTSENVWIQIMEKTPSCRESVQRRGSMQCRFTARQCPQCHGICLNNSKSELRMSNWRSISSLRSFTLRKLNP